MNNFIKKNSSRKSFGLPIVIAVLVVFLINSSAYAQEDEFVPSREISVRLFDKGEFAEALRHFEPLLLKYPADPLYKYYTGACLLELNEDINHSVDLLESSINESRFLSISGTIFSFRNDARSLGFGSIAQSKCDLCVQYFAFGNVGMIHFSFPFCRSF